MSILNDRQWASSLGRGAPRWASNGDLYAASPTGPNDQSLLRSSDRGETWMPVSLPQNTGHPTSVWATGTSVYAVFGGKVWLSTGGDFEDLGPDPNGGYSMVWGSGPNDIWLVGQRDRVAHATDGRTFVPVPTGLTYEFVGTQQPSWFSVWSDGHRVYLAGTAFIASSDDGGQHWSVESDLDDVNQLNCITGSPDGSTVFAVGGFGNVVLRKVK